MFYNNFKGLSLSALGFGCMRLPTKDGKIDREHTARMVEYALKNGINYFDTAWGYHDGESEIVMGEVLSKYPRESFYLADKFPGYDLRNIESYQKTEEIFLRQLEKTKTDYFDFYLIHNVCERNIDTYLDESRGVMKYILEQKAAGRIKHLGFSVHAQLPAMKRFLDKYGKYMEFCQIQLNWLDWEFQDAKGKVELLQKWGLPVWVMEPLRGGKLVSLPEKHGEKLASLQDSNPISLAFRFVQSVPSVCVTLSGMSDMDQLKENIGIFTEKRELSEKEQAFLKELGREMTSFVPCTSCRYCTTYCPQKLDIPELINMYNQETFASGGFLVNMYHSALPDERKPSACIGCGSCEKVCPQQIKIPEVLRDFAKKMSKE